MKALEILKHYQEYKVGLNLDTYCKSVGVKKEYYTKALEELKAKDDEIATLKAEVVKYSGIAAELFVSRSKCLKQIEELEAYCEKGINPERDGEYYRDGYENGKSETYQDILEKLRN